MFNRKRKPAKQLAVDDHCVVVLKAQAKIGDELIEEIFWNQIHNIFVNGRFFNSPNKYDTKKSLENMFLELLVKGFERCDKLFPGTVLFDFYTELDRPAIENHVFSGGQINGALVSSIHSGGYLPNLLSPFTKRYSAEFKISAEALQTLLKDCVMECYGKEISHTKNVKKISKKIHDLFVALHIDLLNEKTNDWVRVKTIKPEINVMSLCPIT